MAEPVSSDELTQGVKDAQAKSMRVWALSVTRRPIRCWPS